MNIKKADTFLKRLKGLLFTKEIGENDGLLLKNCSQVHSFGMNYDIGVYYLDETYKVIDVEYLKKNNIGKKYKATKHILEVHPKYASIDGYKKYIEQELNKEVYRDGKFIE